MQRVESNADRMDLYTVKEAARMLDISPEAVRARLFRGTLQRETGEDGSVYVRLDADQLFEHTDQTHDQSTEQVLSAAHSDSHVEDLRDQVAFLREQLEIANRRDEQQRQIIAMLTSRLPELPASTPSDAPYGPQTGTGNGGKADTPEAPTVPQTATSQGRPRSWWRRIFGNG